MVSYLGNRQALLELTVCDQVSLNFWSVSATLAVVIIVAVSVADDCGFGTTMISKFGVNRHAGSTCCYAVRTPSQFARALL
jgi:hypothetical protein